MSHLPPLAGLEPSLLEWFDTPLGKTVLAANQRRIDARIADIFGFHALQIGLAPLPLLQSSRITHRFTMDWENSADIVAEADVLPFSENALDLVLLPYTLEFVLQPHEVLREVYRVLRPEGQVIICGFNPFSLFGGKRYFGRETLPPWNASMLSLYRLHDWLTLLGFDRVGGELDNFIWPTQREKWLQRLRWMEHTGDRWWPFAGGTYYLHAVKRITHLRVLRPEWVERSRRRRAAAAPVHTISDKRDVL